VSDTDRLRAAVRSENELAMTDLAFDGLHLAMVNELIGTDYDEGPAREHLYHALRALKDVRQTLKDMVKVGNDTKAMEAAATAIAASAKTPT
jgi:hypothetical protein